MKIKIIVPATGIQLVKHVIVHAGDVVDIPFYQAEHLIRLNQAISAEPKTTPLPPYPEDDDGANVAAIIPPTTAEV